MKTEEQGGIQKNCMLLRTTKEVTLWKNMITCLEGILNINDDGIL